MDVLEDSIQYFIYEIVITFFLTLPFTSIIVLSLYFVSFGFLFPYYLIWFSTILWAFNARNDANRSRKHAIYLTAILLTFCAIILPVLIGLPFGIDIQNDSPGVSVDDNAANPLGTETSTSKNSSYPPFYLQITQYVILLIPLFLLLRLIHLKNETWDRRRQIIIHSVYIGLTIIHFIILPSLNVPVVPNHLLAGHAYYWNEATQTWILPMMDSSVFLQILWGIPLWICAWFYNWEIGTPQSVMKRD
jgi:hypothetical protein